MSEPFRMADVFLPRSWHCKPETCLLRNFARLFNLWRCCLYNWKATRMGRRRAIWRPWDLIVCSLAGIVLVILETCGYLEERCHLLAERTEADCVNLQGMLLDFSQKPRWLSECPGSRFDCCASGWASA